MKAKKILSALLAGTCFFGMSAAMTSSVSAEEVIKVGVFLPLTGDNAAGGELELRGVELANKNHPTVLGKKIQLFVQDNKSDKAEAANVVARLIEKDKVCAIVGTYGSSLAMAAGNIVKENKIPTVGTSCTNPQVTKGNDYYFRACFIDPFQGTVMANYFKKLGYKNVAIIQEVSNDYSVGLAKFFMDSFKGMGGKIVEIANYQTGDKDFTAILTNVKAKKPDAIYAPGNFTESALMISQAHQLGLKVNFYGGDTWETNDFLEVGGEDVEGAVLTTAFGREVATTKEAKVFLDTFAKEFKNEEPSALTALAYDAYMMVYYGIQKAGSTDSVAIRNAIANNKNLPLVTGKTTLNADGDPVKGAVIKTVKNGKFVYVDFVQPK
ncbi:MAG: ABC transporter substrate-binding protein [Acidaminococcaceae bacterium]|nr:ABC transporter substrate-binding protein [Acidaminococcaceae bacterium]